jgi:hypothetical protein
MDIVVESDHGVASGVSVSKVDQLKCHMFQRSLENSLKSKFKRSLVDNFLSETVTVDPHEPQY